MRSFLQSHLVSLALSAFLALGTSATLAGQSVIAGQSVRAGESETRLLTKQETSPPLLVPPPPAPDSNEAALELARLKGLIAKATPQRLAQADADGKARDPSVFSAAAGRDLTRLPATYALLQDVQQETAEIIDTAKDYYNQPRPYAIDPSLPHCGKGKGLGRSYPSGHAGFAYSVGWTLARLDPAHAPAVLARASDYALSREICGVHFHSDTEASRVIGTFVADRILADSRMAQRIAAAKAELAGS